MANYLDLAMPIVEKDNNGDFKATTYFEDYLFQIISSIGGEGAESIVDESTSLLITSLQSKVANLENDLANIEHPDQSMSRSKIGNIEKELFNIEQLLSSLNSRVGNLTALLANVSEFKTVPVTSNYTAKNKEILICKNTSPIQVTLNPNPKGGDRVHIKRRGEEIEVIGTIDGLTNRTINIKQWSDHYVYDGADWSVI